MAQKNKTDTEKALADRRAKTVTESRTGDDAVPQSRNHTETGPSLEPAQTQRSASSVAEARPSRQGLPPKGTPAGDAARFDRYRRSGGDLSYDEWFPRSRGGREGGPGHQQIQKRLQNSGMETEVQFGGRWADAVQEGEIHQIGELNRRGDPIARERDAINDIIDSPQYNNETIYFWDKNNPAADKIKIYEDGQFVLEEWGSRP